MYLVGTSDIFLHKTNNWPIANFQTLEACDLEQNRRKSRWLRLEHLSAP